MATMNAEAISSTSREQLAEDLRVRVRELAERGDMLGLAAVAGTSLRSLRMLCERPITCTTLKEMLEMLEQINLDESELSED